MVTNDISSKAATQSVGFRTWIQSCALPCRFSIKSVVPKETNPKLLDPWYDPHPDPDPDSIDSHIETPQSILLEDYNKATAAARPPSTPAPRPTTFCGLVFFVADAAAEDELEVWLTTLEAADEFEFEPFDAEDEALLSAEDVLDVDDETAPPAEEEVDEGALEDDVRVQSCDTAVGTEMPLSLQKPIA